ncbi:MAG: YbjQ family protein [Candidatus Omnitrophota bacterium]
MELLINLIGLFLIVVIAYIIGTMVEISHYKEIEAREKAYMDLAVVSSKDIENEDQIESAQLVSASVVISLDYFKRILAGLRNIVGGRIKSYETLLDRGRREAILRMKEQARQIGFDMVINMRFQTSGIGQVTGTKNNSLGCFEVLAYGTAVKLKK